MFRIPKALLGLVACVAAIGVAAWLLSPWPSALFYRYLFDLGGVAMNQALARHVPAGVTSRIGIQYGAEPIENLDVHLPPGVEGTSRRVPVVFWVHGGGFISGAKDQIANYAKIVAHAGYGVVAINYALAPAARHPTPARQAHAALAFIRKNGAELNLDTDRIFLAGDSAGSNIAAQLGIALSEPAYARLLGIQPEVPRSALRGLALFCGIFDPGLLKAKGEMAGFLKTVGWSYLGTKDLHADKMPKAFSIVDNLPGNMPPMFVTAGNADPLLSHSKALVVSAEKRGVAVDSLFFPDGHEPPLQHEYEFDLDQQAGSEALSRLFRFLEEHLK